MTAVAIQDLTMSAGARSGEPTVRLLGEAESRPRQIALGSFDGVHLGHRRVISGADTVVTFTPHPRAVIGAAPPLLHDFESKMEVLGALGVEEVVLIPFDRALAAMSPTEFVNRILIDALGVTRVAVGDNFRFGSRAAGDVDDLRADPRFETAVEPLLEIDGDVVSSTRIRGLVERGSIAQACRLLGGPLPLRCALGHPDPGGSLPVSWPVDIVRPGAGTYAASVCGRAGRAVAAELKVSAAGARLTLAAPLPGEGLRTGAKLILK